jgi:hypothetical protein
MRRRNRGVALLVAAMAVLGSAGSAEAASVGYDETHTQAIDAGNSLNAVSCVVATTTCVAADSQGNAFYATSVSATSAATWTSWHGPGPKPSEAVSCPSPTLCVFAIGEVSGGGGDVYRTQALGGTFLTSFKPAHGVGAISCPSTSFCVSAAEGSGFIRWSTNPSGILWSAVVIGTGAMKGVSCLSSSFCAVVDDSGNVRVATTASGVKETAGWTATNVNGPTALQDVACVSTTTCLAVDGGDEVLRLALGPSGEATVSRQEVEGADELIAVTCTGTTCAVADRDGAISSSMNAGVDWTLRYSEGAAMNSVSCVSTSLCVAGAGNGDIVTFNPATTTPPLRVLNGLLPAGSVDAPYEAQIEASGGTGPYQWSATGLPTGLSIDSATGEISGTPMTTVCTRTPCPQPSAVYTATITATDSHGVKASPPFQLAIAGNSHDLTVTTAGTGSGKVNASPVGIDECGTPSGACEALYVIGEQVTLTATPTPGSTFRGWSGGGCSGTGTCQFTIGADTVVTATFEAPLKVATGSLPAASVSAPYKAKAEAAGGTPPYQWSATGLPPGLSIDPASGEISGTPMTAVCVRTPCPQPSAVYTPIVTVADGRSAKVSSPLAISIAGNSRSLRVTVAGTGSGEVNSLPAGIDKCAASSGACEALYVVGEKVTLTATPASGSSFTGWAGGGCSGTVTCQLTIGADTAVTATFEKVPPLAKADLRIGKVKAQTVRSSCGTGLFAPRSRDRSCSKLKIAARGTIAEEASGVVSVKASVHFAGGKVRTATKPAQILDGRWQARFTFAGLARNPRATIRLVARFDGSTGVQPERATLVRRFIRG